MISLLKHAPINNFFTISTYFYGIAFIPINSYLFSVRFRGRNENTIALWLGYAWAASLFFWQAFRANHVNLIGEFSWGRYSLWQRNFESHIQMIYLIIPFYIFSLRGFWHLYRGLKESTTNADKIRYRNCLIGFLIIYTGSVDLLPASGFNVYAAGYLSLTGFTCILAYSIIRHQLLDIRVVLKRLSLILVIYAGLFAVLVPGAIPLLKHLLEKQEHTPVAIMLGMGVLIGLIFSLGPLIYAYLVRNSFWLKSNLTTGLTHELKSPLSVITSASDVLIEELASPSLDRDKLHSYGEIIQKSATRMDAYVKDLLNLAKIQDDSIALNKEEFDLTALIESTAETLRPLCDAKALGLKLSLTPSVSLHADRTKIQQVVSNLLSNAIKYSDHGTIQTVLVRNNNGIHIEVKDEGRGISAKNIPKIFDRFYQADPGSKGSGIGLTIAKAWVEAHGGKIWAESDGDGKGTRVRVRLPG